MRTLGIISSSRRWRYQPEIYPFMEAISMPNNDSLIHEGTAYEATGSYFWSRINLFLVNLKIAFGLTLDVNNLFTLFPLIYPTIGGTATAHKYNLSDPSKFEATFYGGWTHDGSGALPNGTNAYMTSTEGLFSHFGYSMMSATFGFDSKTNVDGFHMDLGALDGARPNILLYGRYSGSVYSQFDNQNSNATASVSDSLGLYILNRNGINQYQVHKENVLIASHAKTCAAEMCNAVLNCAGFSGGQNSPRKRTLTFGARKSPGVNVGFSPAERIAFTNQWRAFDNSLNR